MLQRIMVITLFVVITSTGAWAQWGTDRLGAPGFGDPGVRGKQLSSSQYGYSTGHCCGRSLGAPGFRDPSGSGGWGYQRGFGRDGFSCRDRDDNAALWIAGAAIVLGLILSDDSTPAPAQGGTGTYRGATEFDPSP